MGSRARRRLLRCERVEESVWRAANHCRPAACAPLLLHHCGLKISVHDTGQAVVDVNRAMMAKQRLALFLNAHVRFLRAVNHEMVNFVDRFVDKPFGLKDRFAVHANDQRADELVEVEFDKVFFRGPDFEGESHMVRLLYGLGFA